MAADMPLIMLVDDDPDFLDINRHILEPAGYRVRCATDPQAALAGMNEERPDLVITDLMMCNLDAGFSLARQLKRDARFAGVPVIIVTAVSAQAGYDFTPQTPADLAAMSADAYLSKPVAPRELLDRVEALLHAHPGRN